MGVLSDGPYGSVYHRMQSLVIELYAVAVCGANWMSGILILS
jgi:hypothetical protein